MCALAAWRDSKADQKLFPAVMRKLLFRYARRNENFVLVSGEAASTAGAILTPDS